MDKSSEKAKKYIPNPFEAYALKELKQPWRFFDSKEDFEKVVTEFSRQSFQTEGGEITKWQGARANALITLGAQLDSYSEETLDAAEKQIRSDKKLWKKIQAAHLYNTIGIKPEIDISNSPDLNAENIMQKIGEHLDKMEKGEIADGKYVPSKAEKNLLRALGNYGEFIRNPKSEDEAAKFTEEMKKRLERISKRDNFLEPQKKEKQPKKDQRKDKVMSDENKFELNDEQKEFCKTHNIDPSKITSEEAYKEAVKKFSNENENSQKDESPKTDENGGKDNDKDESKDDKEKDDKVKPLGVSIDTPQPEEKTNEEEPDWVKKKAEHYEKLAADGKIQGYEQDKSKEGFAAKLENAEIHYSSPDNVTVSPDAGYKVFATMLQEPDNQGRPIEFPDNASKEIATRLYAACVLHGNPMQGAVPTELDAETLANCGLSEEQIKQVQDHLETSQKKNDGQEKSGEEKTGDEKQISAKAQEDIKKLAEIRNNFNQMKKDGLIAIQKDENGKPQIVKGEKGSEKDVAEATKIMQEATNLVKAGLETNHGESTKLETQEQKDTNESLRQQQIENVRAQMSPEQAKARQEKEDARDLIMAARLGIAPKDTKVTDRSGQEVKAKTGEDLKSYQSNLSKETMARLTQKFREAEK